MLRTTLNPGRTDRIDAIRADLHGREKILRVFGGVCSAGNPRNAVRLLVRGEEGGGRHPEPGGLIERL